MFILLLIRSSSSCKRLGEVIEIPSRYDMQSFFEGEVDAWNGYVINELLTAQEKGFEANVIMPADYGVYMYSDCLFTTEEMVKSEPDLVKSFVQATIKRWRYAIYNPHETISIVLAQDPKLRQEHEIQMLRLSIPLILDKAV